MEEIGPIFTKAIVSAQKNPSSTSYTVSKSLLTYSSAWSMDY
ncbi:hypothetical protein DFR57_11710 [Saliterribacillus persicus]|uniref:Uncharacterized protein n=1 Tax=Saliterribacillus persicus TaxID=930114 RepID=A0A368XBY4_9BACI|nr:hypothetical protein DFR57_11710 [Saliterribacillus persicus]